MYKLYWMNIIHEIRNFLCDGREQLKYQVNKLPPYISALKKQDIIDILTTEQQIKKYNVQCLDKELYYDLVNLLKDIKKRDQDKKKQRNLGSSHSSMFATEEKA